MAESTLRVLLVDDHPLVRDGLCAAFRRILPSVQLQQAGSGPEALEKIAAQQPHLIVLDVNLPGISGVELARQIRASDRQVRILMVAGESDPWTVREAIAAGASGFVAKIHSADCLMQAVTALLNGQRFLCSVSQSALDRAMQDREPASEPPGPAVLSRREREVLRCLAHGENTKCIAALLQISPKTVETHRQHITRKLRLDNVASLTRYAIRHGMDQV